MGSKAPSEEGLLKELEMQWQDHFQTRAQTWKALEITGLVAVALVGLDWRLDSRLATVCASGLLAVVALFGMGITKWHQGTQVRQFATIAAIGKQLRLEHGPLPLEEMRWRDIFLFWKSNLPLFILRMHFAILVFAICYGVLRLSL